MDRNELRGKISIHFGSINLYQIGNRMENYSGLESALGSVVVFSSTLFLGCMHYLGMRKTIPSNDTHQQLKDEVKSLKASILEVNAENKVLEDELNKNIQELVKRNVQLENSPNFFKSARSQQPIVSKTKDLKELNYNLKNTLNSYPEFNGIYD